MQTPQEIQIPVPWGHIAGKSWGDVNDEKMIAVHGMQDNCGVFDRLIPLLKGNYYIIAIDLPGHGFSSPFSQGFPINFMDFVTTIKHVIRYLRWEKFYFLGHSLGGMIGTCFIALYPQHVLKFCMLDHFGPPYVADHLHLSKLRERITEYFEEYDRIKDRVRPAYTYEEALSKLMNRESYLTKEAAEIVLKRSARNNKEGVSFIMDQRLKLPSTPFTFSFMKEVVLNINCPTLIVLSSQRLERYKSWFKELIPIYESKSNVIIKHIHGSHDFHQNNPENLVDIIDHFFINKKSKL